MHPCLNFRRVQYPEGNYNESFNGENSLLNCLLYSRSPLMEFLKRYMTRFNRLHNKTSPYYVDGRH